MAKSPKHDGLRSISTRGTPEPGRIAQTVSIVTPTATPVKSKAHAPATEPPRRGRRPGRPKSRRQSHGSAWHWRQTDCWYYTLPGTKKRVSLLDEDGVRIRGKENKEKARLALARVTLVEQGELAAAPTPDGEWLVARVCSEYIQYCDRGVTNKNISAGHRATAVAHLNDLCKFCGALPVAQLKKTHIRTWVESHKGWKSSATERSALTLVIAAFNYCQDNHDVPSPLKGLKKPTSKPRLHSLSTEEEATLLKAAAPHFRDFLFAANHTGLRPFCELARLKAEDVEEGPRGMMWRVYSSKTDKTRKIPVRPEVADLTRRLLESAPKGSGKTLFRTVTGKAWSKVNGVAKFCELRKKLKWDKDPGKKRYSSYSCRHTFAHRMLSGYWNGGTGCSVETLAELIGDTPKVAFDHYGREWGQHFQDPLWNAIGVKCTPSVGGFVSAQRPDASAVATEFAGHNSTPHAPRNPT
ncbi:MAG: tyrosine-type recombinase/integrase [Planctomycetes bacterium]|nr:tyrosine-type recombinase/integrase [Planctomycetota bacterium]